MAVRKYFQDQRRKDLQHCPRIRNGADQVPHSDGVEPLITVLLERSLNLETSTNSRDQRAENSQTRPYTMPSTISLLIKLATDLQVQFVIQPKPNGSNKPFL